MSQAREPCATRPRTSRAVWALLGFISLLAAWPGLRGGWVHDDLNMVDNPQYSGLDDVIAVPLRPSGDYTRPPHRVIPRGSMNQTYRPLTMLTLVAPQALAPAAWLHHTIGWLLHALTAWLFYLSLRRSDSRAASAQAHGFLAALFLLHPVGVETYVWINGRSDLVAGLWLALLLFVLSGRDVMVATGTRTLARTASLFAIGFLGSASKETFVPASLLAALSFAWPAADREAPAESRLRRAGCALWPTALGVGAYALARTLVLPNAPGVGPTQADNPLATSVGWLFLPKLAAIASHALLSLRAANMQSLSWDQLRALSLGEWLCGALGLFAAGGLLIKRDMRGVLQLAAACAGLAPVVLVMFVIWLGLDRYLYMPLMLILCAASPYAVRAHQALRRASPSLLPFAACAILALAAVNTFVASRAYQSQATWLSTLAAERPEDPSVVVFLATEVGAPRANEVLRGLPPPPWPSAVIAPVIALALAGGSPALAQRAAEYGTLHYPNNALILALTFRLRYLAGQQAQALALLPKLARRSSVCSEVRAQLGMWIERRQGREREQLAAARAALQCGQ